MFGQNQFRKEVFDKIQQLETQILELKKSELEIRAQNVKLSTTLRSFARKIVARLPISIESLEKGLAYDLIFSDEVEVWRQATAQARGTIVDIRAAHEHLRTAIPGSLNIPYDQLAMRLESLPKDSAILLVCDNGIKSVAASELLASKGYYFLYVLKGGMSLYQGELLSSGQTPEKIRSSVTELSV